MGRKVVLFIAASLDGYIADRNGAVDWLGGVDATYTGDYGYGAFLETVDTILMGFTTYHQLVTELSPDQWVYSGKKTYVFTHREYADHENVEFIDKDVCEFVQELVAQQADGKNIWICGGASLVNPLVKHDLIDEYQISIIPVLLGSGIRLFSQESDKIELRCTSCVEENGVVSCVYHRR